MQRSLEIVPPFGEQPQDLGQTQNHQERGPSALHVAADLRPLGSAQRLPVPVQPRQKTEGRRTQSAKWLKASPGNPAPTIRVAQGEAEAFELRTLTIQR